jgi:hypothetical protein
MIDRLRGIAPLRTLALVVMLAPLLTACATLPPAKPATDIKALTGKWEGKATASTGRQFTVTRTIKDDGTWEAIIPELSNPGPRFTGTVRVDKGRYVWRSDTTGRTGTFTLHEGDGRRVLVSRADDGSSQSEETPAR